MEASIQEPLDYIATWDLVNVQCLAYGHFSSVNSCPSPEPDCGVFLVAIELSNQKKNLGRIINVLKMPVAQKNVAE